VLKLVHGNRLPAHNGRAIVLEELFEGRHRLGYIGACTAEDGTIGQTDGIQYLRTGFPILVGNVRG
jgi:hypothetical protein